MSKRFLKSIVTIVAVPMAVAAPPLATPTSAVPSATTVTATLSSSQLQPFIGEQAQFAVAFDNTGSSAGDTGYGPYVDLRFDSAGADGAGVAGDDGITFASASYLGAPLTPRIVTCSGTSVVHPITQASVACSSDAQLVVLQLPFGSFTADQPVATINVSASINGFADVGRPVNVVATAGFAYGASPTGTSPVVSNSPQTISFTPQAIRFTKTYIGPELETATGPNHRRAFRLAVDVATGITVSSTDIVDVLPAQHQFVEVTGTSTTTTATATPSTTTPGGTLSRRFASLVGTASAEDAWVEFSYFIPELAAGGARILDVATGDDVPTINDGQAAATYTPTDPRDRPAAPVILNPDNTAPPTPDNIQMTAKSIAVQKSVGIAVDTGDNGYTPGDTLEYTIQGQISDYFTFDDVVIDDLLGDGQTYLTDYVPTLSVTNQNVTTTSTISADDVTVSLAERAATCSTSSTGTTAIQYRVSDAFAAALASDGGVFTGGRVNGGTAGGSVFTITFRAVVDDAYTCKPNPDDKVDPRDFLVNGVTVTGNILDNAAPGTIVGSESDTSGTRVDIAPTTVAKSIYARNGSTTGFAGSPAQFAANDLITYRLQMRLPASDISGLAISDYLPLPVLAATGVSATALAGNKCATSTDVPGSNEWCFGPADTFQNAFPTLPTVTSNAAANSLTWTYGTRESTDNLPRTIDLLFTLRISNAAFREGLFLTNQVQAAEANSFGTPWSTPAIAQIELTEPLLNIDKGAVDVISNAPTAPTFSANRFPTGVTSFGAAGSAGCTRTPSNAVVSTTSTTAGFPDANVSGADANDVVRFAITVENTGKGLNGAFDTTISDAVPAGFRIPTSGLNLCVTNGAGAALTYSTTGFFGQPGGTAAPLGSGTLTLTDNATTGAISAANATSGTNIAVITYDLQLVPTTAANTTAATLRNTAAITNYAASEGGASFTGITPSASLTDTADISARSLTFGKSFLSSDQTTTTGSILAIGERASFVVSVVVPEGTTNNVTVVDSLPAGLAVADAAPVAATAPGIDITGSFTPTIGANGSSLTYNFGTVTSSGGAASYITVTYSTVVLNVAGNQNPPGTLQNSARLSYTNGQGSTTTSGPVTAAVTVVEPNLVVSKSASSPTVDADDVITYTLQVNHSASTANAHEVVLRDAVPAGLTYQADSLALVSGVAPDAGTLVYNSVSGEIEAAWAVIGTTSTSVIEFDVKVAANYNAVLPFTNTARITWTSLPGSPTATAYNSAGVERTGADGVGGALNDYAKTGAVTVQPIAPQIAKALTATDQVSTGGTNVTIGEVVTYRVEVTLPDGDFPNGFAVVDELPNGLRYVGSTLQAPDFAGTLATPVVTGGTSNGDDVRYAFGASTNPPDGDGTNNSFAIIVTAVVLDVAGNDGILPGQTSLSNTATVQLVGGSLVRSNGVATSVVEPNIALSKTMTPNNPAQGDTVAVTITAVNSGSSDAYGTVVTDQLNANFVWGTVSNIVAPNGWTVDPYLPANGTLTFRLADPTAFAVNAPVSFTFTVDLQPVLPVGTPVPNTVTAGGATTLPGTVAGERTEPDTSGSAQINTAGPDLRLTKDDGKTTVALATPTLTTNTYTLVVTNTGGFQATGVRIVDTLPPGTTFVSVGGDPRCGSGGASGSNRTITISGAIPATNGSVTCTITLALAHPAPVGTTGYSNTAMVSDDGLKGADPTPSNNTATDVDTLTNRTPDLVVTKTDGTTMLAPGQPTTYTVTVTNTGNIGVADVLVTDTLPAGLAFTSCAPLTGTVSVACAASANIVTTRFATIAGGGGSASFTVTAAVNNPLDANIDTVTNTAVAADDGANGVDPTPADNTATDTDDIDAAPDMRIVKTSAQTTVVPGGAVQYSLTVDNHGPQGARNVRVADTIDALMTVNCGSVLPAPTSCNAATGTIVWGSATTGLQPNGTIVANGTFAAGAAVMLTYTANAKSPLPAGTVDFDNTATVVDDGSNGPDPTADNSSTRIVQLTGRAPNLKIVKDDGVTTVTPGTPFAYTLTVSNTGNVGVTGARVTDVLPAGLTLTGCTLDGNACSPTGSPLTLDIGAVQVGTPRVLVLTVVPASPAAAGLNGFTNVATVAIIDEIAHGADADPLDNTDDDIDTLNAAPDLVITKDDGATSRAAGETFSYTLTVSNVGNQHATAVTVSDSLPGLLTALACTPSQGSCDVTGDVLTWTIGNLAGANGTATLTLEVRAGAQVAATVASVANTATVTDGGVNGPEPTPGNNTSTDTDTLVAQPDMEISKSDGETDVEPGDTLTYQIVVDNAGSQTAQGVGVIDVLPDGVTFVSCSPLCDSTTTPGRLIWDSLIEDTDGLVDSQGFDAGGRVTLTVVVRVDRPADSERTELLNRVTVVDNGANGADPTPLNNENSDLDTVLASPDMSIDKRAIDSAVNPGGEVDYVLLVKNIGNQDARNVVVTDTVDPQMTLDCSAGAIVPTPTSCDPDTGVVTWGVVGSSGLTDEGAVVQGGIFDAAEDIELSYSAVADDPLVANTTRFRNTATVADDGTNGVDPPANNSDTVDVPLAGNGPDLLIDKTDGVTSVAPGDTVTYTMTVSNVGNIGSTGVFVTDVLPSGLTFVSCTLDTVACTPNAAGRIEIGSLAGRTGKKALVITATVDSPAAAELDTIRNEARVADDGNNGADAVPTNNTDDDLDTLAADPVLTISKDDGAASHAAGDTFDYTIVVANAGAQDTTDVTVTDIVPSPLTPVSCPATPVRCTISGDTVTWELGDLPGGDVEASRRTLTLTVKVDDVLLDGVDEVTNTASVTDRPADDDDPVTAVDDDDSTLDAAPDLVIGKDDGVVDARPGDTLTYTISVENAGDQAATAVVVTDTLPPGTTFVSCTLGCDSSLPGTLTWTDLQETTPGTLVDPAGFDAGGSAEITVVVTVDAPAASGIDVVRNVVDVIDVGESNGGDPTDGDPGEPEDDNTDVDTDVLDAVPDLAITKDDGELSVVGGDEITYAITFTNRGTQAASGVTVTDSLPAGVTFLSCTDACVADGAPTVVWNVGDLAVGDERTYQLTVRIDDPVAATTRHYVNSVVIADDLANGPDPTPADNTSLDDDTTGIDLAVTKTDGLTTVVPGQGVTYTITVSNNGPTTIQTFELEETLPAALADVTFTPSEGAYDPTSQVWTGFGDFTEGETLTLEVSGRVDAAAVGTLTNRVEVTPPTIAPETNPADNVATDIDELTPQSGLTIDKRLTSAMVRGERATFVIDITNTGPSVATGIVVTDTPPPSLVFVGASPGGYSCSPSGSSPVVCNLAEPLLVGESRTLELTFDVVGDFGASVTNVADVASLALGGARMTAEDSAAGSIAPAPAPPAPPAAVPLPQTGTSPLMALSWGGFATLLGLILVLGVRRRREREA